jgi:hypothetical protein
MGFSFQGAGQAGIQRNLGALGQIPISAISAIKVNGVAGLDFQLARSVRQGCPLAPYLFILAIDVLGYMLADPKHGVEGLTLPRGSMIRD